ncbi:unnamed protein product [Trichobilharzia regenti]|nr:unnamed protein product [Trichobilharzia regenti]
MTKTTLDLSVYRSLIFNLKLYMIDLFLMIGMFKLFHVLFIHYLWCINSSNEDFIHETDEHIYLKIPHGIPVQYQYPMRAGFPPGTLGTEISALIIPPENNAKSELISLYKNITEYKELIDTNKTRITDFHFKFYESLVKLYDKQLNAKEYNKKIFNNLVLKPSNARLQFMMYYCTARLEFTKNLTDDIFISSVTSQPMTDLANIGNVAPETTVTPEMTVSPEMTAAPETTAASDDAASAAAAAPSVVAPSNAVVPVNANMSSNSTAPSNATVSSACAYREGSGFSDEHRSQLNRYNNLCNFPAYFTSTLSKRCSEENYQLEQ